MSFKVQCLMKFECFCTRFKNYNGRKELKVVLTDLKSLMKENLHV